MKPQEIYRLIDTSPMNRGMDGATWMANPDNFAVVKDGNVMLFEAHENHAFEFHWLSTARSGRHLVEDTREAMRAVFAKGAQIIYGLIPADHRASRIMARAIGAKCQGRFLSDDGPVVLFVMLPEYLERAH